MLLRLYKKMRNVISNAILYGGSTIIIFVLCFLIFIIFLIELIYRWLILKPFQTLSRSSNTNYHLDKENRMQAKRSLFSQTQLYKISPLTEMVGGDFIFVGRLIISSYINIKTIIFNSNFAMINISVFIKHNISNSIIFFR